MRQGHVGLPLSLARCALTFAQYDGRIRNSFYCDSPHAIANFTVCTESQLYYHHLVPLSVSVKQSHALGSAMCSSHNHQSFRIQHLDLCVGHLQEGSSGGSFLRRLWLPPLQLYAALLCNATSWLLLNDVQ